jgi:delta 1-pyrroline-5-carboxylate dehydrogenase
MSSASERVWEVFDHIHGVDKLTVHAIACRPVQRVKTWHKLERAAILAFREIYGTPPRLNGTGQNMVETDEFDYFNREVVKRFIHRFAG